VQVRRSERARGRHLSLNVRVFLLVYAMIAAVLGVTGFMTFYVERAPEYAAPQSLLLILNAAGEGSRP
jgi:hypothetical protein